jgi:uncharacterized RDD family membrane protein YckC
MRCPKCHYLSFDPEPRCRNCGYGLSLQEPDLLMRDEGDTPSPFADLALHETADETREAAPAPPALPVADPPQPRRAPSFAAVAEAPADREPSPMLLPPPKPRAAPTTELPLFVRGTSPAEAARVDEPLVRLSAERRRPLSVRRKGGDPPAQPRPAPPPERATGPLDRDLLSVLTQLEDRVRKSAGAEAPTDLATFRVGAAKRLMAAAIDGTILGSLSAAVVWLTLRWCGLPLDRVLMLPLIVPTGAFLALLGVGYLVMFTAAGGQTLGKMAAGIRVIGDAGTLEASGPLSLGRALLRAIMTLPSVLIAGVGFFPALVGDERAVHDRLARTRVVRA